MRVIVTLVLFVSQCNAVMYTLNESEYNKMPPLYSLEDYKSCMLDPGGTYCLVDAELFTEGHSDLMKLIREYSAHTLKHYNHTLIHRGVCVTKSCPHINKKLDLSLTLEECLNNSIWSDYRINAKIHKIEYCKHQDDKVVLDTSDIVVAIVCFIIIVFNIIGSLYDILFCLQNNKSDNQYLLSFSIRRNWTRLVAPSNVGSEPRLERLKSFYGLRAMSMVCVIFSHLIFAVALGYVNNPLYVEKSYDDVFKQILYNGSLITHTFFVMSSFLLAYNFEIYAEKHQINWIQLPKGIFLRWIRLTPAYALIIAITATWMRHVGDGPMWDLVVTSESNACRRYWWAHILYINNYLYNDALCAPQSWYLAADTQLFCLGLMVCVGIKRTSVKKVVLMVMMALSIMITALHTYLENLDAVVIQSPETIRTLYAHDDTFRLLYTRGHTNLSTYTLGLAGGFIAYHWQKEGKNVEKYKKYRWVVWMLFPIGVAVILSGAVFYTDTEGPSTTLRVLYAACYKPLFQLLIVIVMLSCVFRIESVYRGIVEWRGFTWAGRVSYSAFLVHTVMQRGLVGSLTMPTHMSDYYLMVLFMAFVMMSFMVGAVLWLCVEAPIGGLTKALLATSSRQRSAAQ